MNKNEVQKREMLQVISYNYMETGEGVEKIDLLLNILEED